MRLHSRHPQPVVFLASISRIDIDGSGASQHETEPAVPRGLAWACSPCWVSKLSRCLLGTAASFCVTWLLNASVRASVPLKGHAAYSVEKRWVLLCCELIQQPCIKHRNREWLLCPRDFPSDFRPLKACPSKAALDRRALPIGCATTSGLAFRDSANDAAVAPGAWAAPRATEAPQPRCSPCGASSGWARKQATSTCTGEVHLAWVSAPFKGFILRRQKQLAFHV